MAQIILFGNQKGGIGKTTLTILCANGIANAPFNKKVLVIDNDNQRSICNLRAFDEEEFHEVDMPYTVRFMTYQQIIESIDDIDSLYDYIFIDTPGKLDANLPVEIQHVTKILTLVDCVFLPFRAGALNLDATSNYLKLLFNLQELRAKSKRPLALWGLVNAYRERTRINSHLKQEINFLKDNTPLQFMRAKLNNYVAYEDINTFSSLYEKADTGDRVKINFSIFFNEFLKIIQNG